MQLQETIMESMKTAMKAKDAQTLEALRAVKSALLLAQTTSSAQKELTEADEIKLLQKLVKQRKESAAIYIEQGRDDLARPELAQAEVIEKFLPAQLDTNEVELIVAQVIADSGATSMADMGKVMGLVNAKVAGKADGKTISNIVKAKLSK